MKRDLIILISLFAIIGILVSPASARNVFELNVIRCGESFSSEGCGSNSPATDPLSKGEVEVNDDGSVEVKLKGALPNTSYRLFVGNWVTAGGFQLHFVGDGIFGSIGTVTTDFAGNFEGYVSTDLGEVFIFPLGLSIGQPNFAFNNPWAGPPQFTTGFIVNGDLFDDDNVGGVGNVGDDNDDDDNDSNNDDDDDDDSDDD